MLTIANHRGLKFTNFFLLYFLQGWVAGFSGTALLNLLASRGTSVSDLGRFSFIAGLPWICQFFWAPLVDRFANFKMGRRRTWILGALIPANVALATLAFISFTPIALASAVLIAALFLSITDTAVDGMMIDLVSPSESGQMSAVTNAGSVIGGCLSSVLFSWTLAQWNFSTNIVLLVLVSLLIMLFPVFIKERETDKFFSFNGSQPSDFQKARASRFLTLLIGRLTKPFGLVVLGISFLVFFSFGTIALSFNAELVQNGGWSAFELSRFQSVLGIVSGTVGAYVVGKLCDHFGDRRVLVYLFTMSALFFVHMALAPVQNRILSLAFLTVMPGLLFVATVPSVMTMSRGAVAATTFTLCMTVMNFGGIAGAGISDFAFQHLSRAALFAIQAALFAITAALVIFVKPMKLSARR